MVLGARLVCVARLSVVFVFVFLQENHVMISPTRAKENKDYYGTREEDEWMREPSS